MRKVKRMAGLFLIAALLFCPVIVSSAATQATWNEMQGYSDADVHKEYYHFDFTEKQEQENEPKPEDVTNLGFWIGLGTTTAGGLIAAVIITRKKSEDEE